MVYVSISIAGKEDDGTLNYLIESQSKLHHKSISFSTKTALPYKEKEVFLARFRGECQKAWSFDESGDLSNLPLSWRKEISYICNAESLETLNGKYYTTGE